MARRALIVNADEMATGTRIFREAVAAVAAQPDTVARHAAEAGAMHEGEVDA